MKTESDRSAGSALSSALSASSAVKSYSILQAESPTHVAQARELFVEYARSLGFSLCFQNFDKELAEMPGDYAPPDGRLLLGEYDGEVAACAALRKIDFGVCEMKRLYLRLQFRGKGLGRAVAERLVAEARQIGYQRMRLDNVEPVMKDAVAMYRKLGFVEIAPYRSNPIAGAMYMELKL
jgi:GNAT superfamily N-acetyltransferase